MKRTALLNRHISTLIASLGHLDEIVIADAGLPVPAGVPVIDVAITPGLPSFLDVLETIKTELAVEEIIVAEEASISFKEECQHSMSSWMSAEGRAVKMSTLSHSDFKMRNKEAKAIIRTGETTPYANMILVSGVVF